jgi:hypothetical protein
MTTLEWVPMPIGLDAPRWITRTTRRTVVVVVHTLASCQRLLDVVEQIETDPRVQVVFTVAPDAFNRGLAAFLGQLGAVVLPWAQATRERFDLAVAAAYGGLAELHAPLMVMAHGAGYGKRLRRPTGDGRKPAPGIVYGLDAQRLMRNGTVLASAIVLTHENERAVLARQCPEALGVALVAGDPCLDRLVASLPWRDRYRAALGLADHLELVVVSSTWGPDGLFGNAPDLLPRIMDQLAGSDYRIAALLHPAVWSAHGERQVRAWLRDCRESGLILIEPAEDWRALVIASDYLIGDHGSVTAYGAAIGRPVLHLAPVDRHITNETSAQHLVLAAAGRLDLDRPLAAQLRASRPLDRETVAATLTSHPGRADQLIRASIYRLLRLRPPGRHRRVAPVPVPRLGN